jgi:hypothetical protein
MEFIPPITSKLISNSSKRWNSLSQNYLISDSSKGWNSFHPQKQNSFPIPKKDGTHSLSNTINSDSSKGWNSFHPQSQNSFRILKKVETASKQTHFRLQQRVEFIPPIITKLILVNPIPHPQSYIKPKPHTTVKALPFC